MSLEAHHRFILDTMQRNQDIARNIINELEAENARLKAEVARLRASSFVTAVPVEQYERLVKAGDAMALSLANGDRMEYGDHDEPIEEYMNRKEIADWNAAKEGKQP